MCSTAKTCLSYTIHREKESLCVSHLYMQQTVQLINKTDWRIK